ncbi:MAG: hypothetical protein ACJ8FY_25010 [Gemmataceae bacterium]
MLPLVGNLAFSSCFSMPLGKHFTALPPSPQVSGKPRRVQAKVLIEPDFSIIVHELFTKRNKVKSLSSYGTIVDVHARRIDERIVMSITAEKQYVPEVI